MLTLFAPARCPCRTLTQPAVAVQPQLPCVPCVGSEQKKSMFDDDTIHAAGTDSTACPVGPRPADRWMTPPTEDAQRNRALDGPSGPSNPAGHRPLATAVGPIRQAGLAGPLAGPLAEYETAAGSTWAGRAEGSSPCSARGYWPSTIQTLRPGWGWRSRGSTRYEYSGTARTRSILQYSHSSAYEERHYSYQRPSGDAISVSHANPSLGWSPLALAHHYRSMS